MGLDVTPVLENDQGANTGRNEPIEKLARQGQTPVDPRRGLLQADDPVIPGVGDNWFYRGRLQAERVRQFRQAQGPLVREGKDRGVRRRQLDGFRNQLQPQNRGISFTPHRDAAVGIRVEPVLVGLGEPPQAAVLVTNPDKRPKAHCQSACRDQADSLVVATAATILVEVAGAFAAQRDLEAQRVDPHTCLWYDREIDTNHTVEFNFGVDLDSEGLPA